MRFFVRQFLSYQSPVVRIVIRIRGRNFTDSMRASFSLLRGSGDSEDRNGQAAIVTLEVPSQSDAQGMGLRAVYRIVTPPWPEPSADLFI